MKQIKARTLLNYTIDELWNSLIGEFKLEFDDGTVIDTNYKETLYSFYFWTFHINYPNTPLLPTHHVSCVLSGNRCITGKTHVKLLKNIYWDVVDTYKAHTHIERDPFTRMIYQITNLLYNDLPPRIEEHMLTLDALDFVNMVTHPKMEKILDSVTEERSTVDKAQKDIMEILQNDESVNDNALARCVRYGSVQSNQVLQCVGPRGFVTEVDSAVLGKPVTRSFTQGMRSIYNLAAESRSAAKSLYYSEKPLQDSEYFARKLQLLTMSVERLHYCDCGSKKFLYWRVNEPVDGYKGDLPNLVGKYYLLENEPDDAPLKVVKATDTHLIGKTIKLRSVLYCQHPDSGGVCEVCFGEMAYNVNQYGNLGHNCSASFTSVISQMVLSTKHYDASAKSESIHLAGESLKYFCTDKNQLFYKLRKEVSKLKPKIRVNQKEVLGVQFLERAEDVKDLSLNSVSSLTNITLILTEPSGAEILVGIDLLNDQNKKRPMFSHDFLDYIKRYGWTVDNNCLTFDLSMWDYNKAVMKFPEMERNYVAYQDEIRRLIEPKQAEALYRRDHIPPTELLRAMFDLINHKQSANISLMEIVIYALCTSDPENGYYGLSRNVETPRLGDLSNCVKHRSLSAAYAFEYQNTTIMDPSSFYVYDRPDSILDVFITPDKVMAELRNREKYR